MGSAEIGDKIFLTTNVLLKYEKVRISLRKDNNDLMEHFFKLHSKWSQNAITVNEEVAMQYRSLEKAMKMDSTALMEHFLSLFVGDNSTIKEEYREESIDSLTSQPTQSASIGEDSTPPVIEYNNASVSQDDSTNVSPRNLNQSRDNALCSISSNLSINNSSGLYMDNQESSVPTVHVPLDSGVSLHQVSGTSSISHTFSQKRKLSGSSDGDVPATKIPGIQHHVHHLHSSQSSGELMQQENVPDRQPLLEGTTSHNLFNYQTGSTRNDYGKASATFSLQDVEQQGIRISAFHSDRSKDSSRDISKSTLDFTEGVSQVSLIDTMHSLRHSVDRVSMGSTFGTGTLERPNLLGMNVNSQSAKVLHQNRVSTVNSINIHPQPGTSGVNQSFSGAMAEFDLSAVKIEVNSDEELEEVSHESGDQEALAAMVTDAEGKLWRKTPGDTLADDSTYQFYTGNKELRRNEGFSLKLQPPSMIKSLKAVTRSRLRTNQFRTLNKTLVASQAVCCLRESGGRPSKGRPDFSFEQLKNSLDFSLVDWSYFSSAQKTWSIKEKLEYMFSVIHNKFEKPLVRMQASYHLGYYMCKYKEMNKVECFSFIGKHMSMKHARCYRQLYRDLGCYRTLAHCTMPLRNIIARIKYVRNLIKSQTVEEKQLLLFPPNSDPYQFLKAYEEWYNLKESAVYQLGLPDNRCCNGVIDQYTKRVLTGVTKEGMWVLEQFLNNSAEEDKYVLMHERGSSGNCFLLQRGRSGTFILDDHKLQFLKNIELEAKVHLLTIT